MEERIKELAKRQKRLNKMFEEEGLTDDILREQIKINFEKAKFNINFDNEKINGEYVQ